ncbi:ExeA family protein [Desulfoferrobacter suflitae]|uniref:ExeA family protein n=1 Tax=Desulfoferrobacter suflitae TaxID=2865782 RepID=UPI002164D90D|nr:AAA family ATPase [Desulfoferrobacter suflitae]MCK8603566.1 AAA family ATPase [Desulfoferrobacter suflitae]
MSMYIDYFGLNENPFSIAPDPRYMYLSDQHREALAHLLYGIASEGGFVMLTGEVGTGKTTICRCLLEQIPENCDVAFIFNPKLTVEELLSTICDEFRVAYPAGTISIKVFVDLINNYLLQVHANNRKAVLIIDEAQNLNSDVLEQIRLLTNLETNQRKLLQIILLGQPELRDKLARPELRQLSQRIVARHHLGPLGRAEVAAYVNHRLTVAGARRPIFPAAVLNQLYRLSKGIPRLINVLSDRALLGCYVEGKEKVDQATLKKAAREVFGTAPKMSGAGRHAAISFWALITGVIVLGGTLLGFGYYHFAPRDGQKEKFSTSQSESSSPVQSGTSVKKEIAVKHNAQSTDRENEAAGAADAPATAIVTGDLATAQDGPGTSSALKDSPEPARTIPPNEPEPMFEPQREATAKEQQNRTAESAQTDDSGANLTWPADPPMAASEGLAYRDLFNSWGAVFAPDESLSPCRQAEAQGLQCLAGKGGLDDLRKFNRPAILQLFDGQGREFYATLTALSGERAEFLVASKKLTVAIKAVALHWLGDYTLLWRTPPGYQGLLKMGDQGPAVAWLRQQLAHWQGMDDPGDSSDIFDATLQAAVKQFQLSSGLQPDGIAGPQTLILLNNAAGSHAPLLNRDHKG